MKKFIIAIAALIALAASCKNDKNASYVSFISPEAGTKIKAGNPIIVNLQFKNSVKVDSVVYQIDSSTVATKIDTSNVSLSSSNLAMGNHLITANIYSGGTPEKVSSNIIVVAAKAPAIYTYQVVHTYPHDTTSFTEGLEYHDGFLYESDGEYGASSLRKVELKTGKVLQSVPVADQYFAEGIALVGDKIIQLTYKEHVGFVYDKTTFKKLSEFNYQAGAEGWGLCFDGKRLLNTSTGTNDIFFLNPNTYQKEGGIQVYDDNGPINNLNEIEVIDDKIYCNVWMTNDIVIVNPKTGEVEAKVNLAALDAKKNANADVLNGIAWDAAGQRLFITGKKWDKLYEIKLMKQ